MARSLEAGISGMNRGGEWWKGKSIIVSPAFRLVT